MFEDWDFTLLGTCADDMPGYVIDSLLRMIPLGLLLWSLFHTASLGTSIPENDAVTRAGCRDAAKFFLSPIGWGALGGGLFFVFYIFVLLICSLLGMLPPSGDPSRGGSGGIEYLIVALPIVAVGTLIGVVIAASRSQRTQARGLDS